MEVGGNFTHNIESVNGIASESQTLYIEHIIPMGSYNLERHCSRKENLSDDFVKFFGTYEELNITEERVKVFFQEFGEVFPTQVLFGGKAFIDFTLTKEQANAKDKTEIEGKARATLSAWTKILAGSSISGGLAGGRDSCQHQEKANFDQEFSIETLGGDPLSAGQPKEWLESLGKSPESWAVIKVLKQVPTYSLLDENIRKNILYLLGETEFKELGYRGEWRDGKRHGRGREIFDDKEIYEGEWKDNLKHGKGRFTYADGTIDQGDWINGRRYTR